MYNGDASGIAMVLQRNAVALISLVVALGSLGYNTWRNETTEAHRSTRQAAFVMLEQLGELQQLVDQRYYGGRRDERTRINAWGTVAVLRDISPLVSPATAAQAGELALTWEERLPGIDAGDAAAEHAVTAGIRSTREQVMAELMALQ